MLFKTATGTPLGDRLLALLAQGPMKKNQFTDHINRPVAVINEALEQLVAAGKVKMTKQKQGVGRPAEVYEAVTGGQQN
jgi:predicted ArsR family transcriptional regulator